MVDIVKEWKLMKIPLYQYCGQEIVYQTLSKMTKEYTVYPKEQRAKPDDLIGNQTSLARRWTIIHGNKYVIYLAAEVRGGWCYDSFGFAELSSSQLAYTVPNTNWELLLRTKIKDEYLNLSSHIAEFRQTTDMFLNTVKAGYRYMRYLKCKAKSSPNYKGCDKWLPRRPDSKTPSGVALSLDFGILPLAGDLSEGLLRMNEKYHGRSLRKRFSVIDRKSDEQQSSSGPRYYIKTSDRATFYVEFETNISEFTAGNIPEALYEATFLSFVVDWMIPVGQYLSSLDALKGVAWTKGTVTNKTDVRCNIPSKLYNGKKVLNNPLLIINSYERTVLNTVPFADLPMYKPSDSLRNVWQGMNLLNIIQDYFKT
jgi:hypothetical protein